MKDSKEKVDGCAKPDRERKLLDFMGKSLTPGGKLYKDFLNVARRIVGNSQDAEDAIQDFLYKMVNGKVSNIRAEYDNVDDGKNQELKGYAFVSLRRICIRKSDENRRRNKHISNESDLGEEGDEGFIYRNSFGGNSDKQILFSPYENALLNELERILIRSISNLSDVHRETIIDWWENQTHLTDKNEGVKMGTRKRRLYYARKRLTEKLPEEYKPQKYVSKTIK